MNEHFWWCTEGHDCACDPDTCTCERYDDCLVHGYEAGRVVRLALIPQEDA